MPAPKTAAPSTLKTDVPGVQPVKTIKPEPLKTLLSWEAPVRVFKKRSREYFSTLGAIVFLLLIILVFLKEWFLIVAVVALAFVNYIMSTIEPQKVGHRITNRGIASDGKNYYWPDLGRFWFTQKWNQKMLHVETRLTFPRQLIILLGETKKAQLKKILAEYLLFEAPEKSWVENASEWLSRRVPLEKS